MFGPDSGKEGLELFRLRIVAHQLAPLLHSDHVEPTAVGTWNGHLEIERTESQLDRFAIWPSKQPYLFAEGPEV
ncbi:MAG: hypothetical protein DMG57_27120 [Acidobacteria bacterium]|nr:MAG: hypothetical protein DMG57_27120 [Acidobacteriota bacterium]